MENKRLIKKTGIYFIGNLSSKILSVLLVPLYAFYIGANDLGEFDYSNTLVNVFVPIAFLAIWEAILRFLLAENETEKKKKMITSSSFFAFFASILLAVAIFVYYHYFSYNRYTGYIMLMMVVSGLTTIWQYYSRALGRNKVYVLAAIVGTTINFLCNVIFICVFKKGIEALYISNIVGNLAICLTIEFKLRITANIHRKDFDFKILKQMLIFSAPLVINLISAWAINGFGKIIITNSLGANANGLYAFANKFSIIVTFIGSVLNMAIIEEAILIGKEGNMGKEFAKTIQNIFEKFILLLIVAIPAITVFYYLIGSTEYYTSRIYFPFLLFYALLMTMSTNIGSVFQAINKTKYIFITTVLGAIFTVSISVFLINQLGVFAVVLGQTVGAFTMLISRYCLIQKFASVKLNWKRIILLIISYFILGFISLKANVALNVIIELIIFSVLAYIYKGYIQKGMLIVRRKLKKDN